MTTTAVARWAFLGALVLPLILFIPAAWWPFMVGKVAVAAICLLIAGIAGAVALVRRELELPAAALLVGALPLMYLISYAASSNKAVGFLGSGIDGDSVIFIAMCFATFLLGSMLVRDAISARRTLLAVGGALALAALVQAVVLTVGLPGPFADRSYNLIGKWNDFALGMAVLLSFIVMELQSGRGRGGMRIGMWVVALALLVLLGLVNFLLAWALLFVVALCLGTVGWVRNHQVPWASIAVVAVAVVFLFFGTALSSTLAKVLPASSLEVRPSLTTTLSVIEAARGSSVKSAALGTGPNTFSDTWLMHKPQDVNRSAFWNLDFSVGFSTLMTAFGSVGLLGALAWLIAPLLLVWGLWRSRGQEGVLWSIAVGALILWAAVILYVPSSSMLLAAFGLTGAAVGLSYRSAMRARGAVIVTAVVLALIVAGSGILSARRAVANMIASAATAQANAGQYDKARGLALTASQIDGTPDVWRLRADIAAAQAAQLAAATSTPQTQSMLTALLEESTGAGQQAIALDPQDYRSYLSLARLYDFLAVNKVNNAVPAAKGFYEQAALHAPLNPSIPLLLARLEASTGTSTAAVDGYLTRALTLKPDYTDAIIFIVQLDIARNDLPAATRDATVAVRTAPGVPSLWFELGLLYYAQNDTVNAIPAFEQALVLEPNYANAQYFLGLSYAAQNRTADAKALFEKLGESNPGNAEVQSILNNIAAGRSPLGTSTPPTLRPNAPIQ